LAATIAIVVIWDTFRPPNGAPVLEASGTVEATEAALGFAASGRIYGITVHEGETAREGSVLAVLDTVEVMARVRQLRDQAQLAAAQLRDLEQGARPQEIDDRRQATTAAKKSLDDADADVRRMRALLDGGAVSSQTLEKAQLARDVAATRYAQARAALSLAEEGARRQQIAAARASLAATHSQVTALEATIPNFFIRSPWTGLVTDRVHEPGEAVTAGMPVLSIMNPNDRWVRIYIPERDVGAVRVGQRASITSDAFPTRQLAGHVRWIASEAEFTPRNVQTKDDRTRLVYAAKVQIDEDSAMVLKPGTPADVRVKLASR
jgi:HlyD family secretion protein